MQIHSYARCFIKISGNDASSFLQGMITQDITLLKEDALLFTAFLSPQGKLLYDGFLFLKDGAIILDIDAQQATECLATLTRYKLRADVRFSDADLTVSLHKTQGMPDPRESRMPRRHYAAHPLADALEPSDYHRIRLDLAIPEAAYDAQSDTPMDLAYDCLNAISFTKGCYIGQEVTARMKYKQIVRKLPLRIASSHPFVINLSDNTAHELVAGDKTIGSVRSFIQSDTQIIAHEQTKQNIRNDLPQEPPFLGIAVIKLADWHEAISSHIPIMFHTHPIHISCEKWCAPRMELWSQGQAAHLTEI